MTLVRMTPERWQKVKEIFDSALQVEPAQRPAFLSNACGGDDDLRKEVETLIASHEKDGSFIDSPAYEAAAELLADEKAELKPGQVIGSYEIISFISRGGMGEVYLGQDKRLGRRVALKLLPSTVTKDVSRLRRFEQEARAASALNHPNILTIYEIREANSTLVIATEFVEGETLRQRLAHDMLDLNEALHIAIQIADALAAAHKAGIIHRDIKPENIMIRPDGYVKMLDFGLAKLIEHASPMSAAEAPTKQVKTGSGMIMGTVGYMSPEQARGQTVDARSDIFNLGAVIYEMVARQKPFDGETPSDVFAAILKTEPPLLSHFAPEAPPELVRIVTKALRKDREQRYQVIKDMLLDLKSLKEEMEFQAKLDRSVAPSKSYEVSAASSQSQTLATEKTPSDTSEIKTAVSTITHSLSAKIKRHKTGTIIVTTALVVATILGIFALYKFLHRSWPAAPASTEAPQVLRTTQLTTWTGLDDSPSFSPDGNSIAYSSDHNGTSEIYIRSLVPGAREIQLTSDDQQNFQPAWSPDGKLIAYHSRKRPGIWIVTTTGGAVKQLTDFGASAAWSPDGSLIAFQSQESSLPPTTIWIVPLQGVDPKQITQVGNPSGGHSLPSWSPDGKRIVFIAWDGGKPGQLWTVSGQGADLKEVLRLPGSGSYAASVPVHSPNGKHLYFGGITETGNFALYNLDISPASGEALGEPLIVANTGLARIVGLTISSDGKKLAYSAHSLVGNLMSLRVLPNSNESGSPPTPLTQSTSFRKALPAFSHDGRKIAFTELVGGKNPDIWVVDVDGQNLTQLTTNPAIDWSPSWFPDNDTIAFESDRDGKQRIWSISVSTGREKLLVDPGQPIGWPRLSPDGKQIAFNSTKSGTINVWTVTVEGGTPRQLTFDSETMGWPCWSPDGKLLALEIKRGEDTNIAIMPSTGGEVIQLTFDHGSSLTYDWSPDGDKILFAGQRNGIWNVYCFSHSTKQQKQLTHYTNRNEYVRYPAWSPLGNQIVYEYTETSGNIWLMELK